MLTDNFSNGSLGDRLNASTETFATAEDCDEEAEAEDDEDEEEEENEATVESPLLPIKEDSLLPDKITNNNNNNYNSNNNYNNNNNSNTTTTPNHISTTKSSHQPYTAVDTTTATTFSNFAPSTTNARRNSTGNSSSSPYSSTQTTPFGTPTVIDKSAVHAPSASAYISECRRRSSITSLQSLQRFDGNNSTIQTTTTTDGNSTDTTINIGENNNNGALYSNYNYTTTTTTGSTHDATHTTHTHSYNLYPQDFFANLEGKSTKTCTKMQSKVDAVGRVTGEWGRWQLRAVLLIFLCKIPSSWFMACIIFTAPSPRHGEFFCKPPNTIGAQNQTMWIKVSHPQKEEVDDQEFSIDFCNVYQDAQEHAHHYYHFDKPELEPKVWEEPISRNANVIPCQQFEHSSEYHSVITQYDLVCSRDILVSVTQFFHLFGVLTGGILANHLLKYFSPRHVMLFGMVTQIFCGNLTGHVASYELHVFFRCLSAVCCCQMYTAGGMIMADITGGKYKTYVSTLFEQFWSIGVIMLPGVASFFTSWSHLYMAISWPTVILIYLWQWIPDSPRWMIARGRVLDAKKILQECIEINGTRYSLPHDIDQQLQLQAQTAMDAPPPASWWTIWKGEKAVRHMVCVHIVWSIYIVIYYGMLLNIRSFSREHLEVNTVVAGLCEIIGTFIGLFFIVKASRKWLWTGIFNVIAGIITYLGWLVPIDIPINARVALLMLSAMISKTAISSTLAILTTCTTELVSDEKKKICAYSTICWARFWLLGAPFIGATVIFGDLVPQTAFGSLAIIGGVLTTLISSPRTISKQKTNTLGAHNMATATQYTNNTNNNANATTTATTTTMGTGTGTAATMTTLNNVGGIDNKAYTKGPNNPIFTSITKITTPHSNLPPELMPGIWTTKSYEENGCVVINANERNGARI